jgi:hypothetical protein
MKKIIFDKGTGKNRSQQEAERLGISEQSLMLLYKKGIVPAIRVSARIILFDPVVTDEALAAHAAASGKDGNSESIYPKAKPRKKKNEAQPVTTV